jgi:hypothetical protein
MVSKEESIKASSKIPKSLAHRFAGVLETSTKGTKKSTSSYANTRNLTSY